MTAEKKKILHRVKIIKGHLTAVEKMIQDDQYCIDIVHQSQAIQKALKNLDMKVIEDHIKHCVVKQAKGGNTQKITDDLLKIYQYK